MDDERIERALRAGPADEPQYSPLGRGVPVRQGRANPVGLRAAFELLGTIAVALAVVVSIVVLRSGDQVATAIETNPTVTQGHTVCNCRRSGRRWRCNHGTCCGEWIAICGGVDTPGVNTGFHKEG